MRIVELNREARENILSGLLKRDPNNYQEYEATVRQIVDDVRERATRPCPHTQKNSTESGSPRRPSV